MPISNREIFQLSLILLCVPAQYLITLNLRSSHERSQAVFHLLNFKSLRNFKDTWLQMDTWKDLLNSFTSSFLKAFFHHANILYDSYSISDETSPAIEVIEYRENNGFFGMSLEPRTVRPYHLRFRVGQVVRHRILGFRAVVYGWDLTAKAPEHWLQRIYGKSKVLREWPHYALIVDSRDWNSSPTMYIVQEQLELQKSTEVQHPKIEEHFQYFDGAQYIPKKKLQSLYPKD